MITRMFKAISPGVSYRVRHVVLITEVSYLERWQGSLSYTMHAGKNNNLGDRDFVSASVKYSF